MYTQKGKMVYMMKNTIKEELLGEVTGEMGPSLKEAKHLRQVFCYQQRTKLCDLKILWKTLKKGF